MKKKHIFTATLSPRVFSTDHSMKWHRNKIIINEAPTSDYNRDLQLETVRPPIMKMYERKKNKGKKGTREWGIFVGFWGSVFDTNVFESVNSKRRERLFNFCAVSLCFVFFYILYFLRLFVFCGWNLGEHCFCC